MRFSATLGRFNRETKDRLDRIRRIVIIKLFSAVIKDTPVLTGRLRGNWQTTINSPATGVIGIRDEAATIAEVQRMAAQSKGSDVVILRNNLPYAYRIEFDGWSRKAPQGMMRRNAIRFRRILNQAVREARL
ncbi:MAG: hypothetical protein WC132_05480 [Methanomethylophilus sp.]